jgi:chaperone BCS1
MAHTATRLVTYTPAKGNTYWHETSSRPARSLESVVLPSGVKERVVVDLEEFLGGAKWYAERGE